MRTSRERLDKQENRLDRANKKGGARSVTNVDREAAHSTTYKSMSLMATRRAEPFLSHVAHDVQQRKVQPGMALLVINLT